MTPSLALLRMKAQSPSALLVQRPQSPVVHVSVPPVTRRGRRAPICRTRGKRWPAADPGPRRRLCARCERRVVAELPAGHLLVDQILTEIDAARDERDLEQLRIHVIQAGPGRLVDKVTTLAGRYARRRSEIRAAELYGPGVLRRWA